MNDLTVNVSEPLDEEEAGSRPRRTAVSFGEEALQRKRIPQVSRQILTRNISVFLSASTMTMFRCGQAATWRGFNEQLITCLSFSSPSSVVQATPTTFGDLRLANGHSAQRRRVTSGPPPSGLQDWLHIFQVSTRFSLSTKHCVCVCAACKVLLHNR